MATFQKFFLVKLSASVIVNRWAASAKKSLNYGQIF